jgi:hypothetical protein
VKDKENGLLVSLHEKKKKLNLILICSSWRESVIKMFLSFYITRKTKLSWERLFFI